MEREPRDEGESTQHTSDDDADCNANQQLDEREASIEVGQFGALAHFERPVTVAIISDMSITPLSGLALDRLLLEGEGLLDVLLDLLGRGFVVHERLPLLDVSEK